MPSYSGEFGSGMASLCVHKTRLGLSAGMANSLFGLRRRGYATESQRGLLLVEKLDYLQSKLLQNIFFSLSKPLGKLGKWINEVSQSSRPDTSLNRIHYILSYHV
jgi:hypothetical protein